MIIDLALRTGIVVAIIMATKRYDVWDSSDEAQEVYHSTVNWASPYAKRTCDYLNIHIPPLPPQREKSYLGVYYYNQTVMTLIDLLNMGPTYIHAVLEQVPGFVTNIVSRAREQYDKYKKQRAEEIERKERKRCIDERALVQPLEPYSDDNSKCRKKLTEPRTPLEPKDVPKRSPCPKPSTIPPSNPIEPKDRLSDRRCKCPKCDIREADGWLDNKPKCPNRDSSERQPITQFKEAQDKCKHCKAGLKEPIAPGKHS